MPTTIIGVDPHKRSHTAVVLDAAEQIDSQVQVPADRRQVDRLLVWAKLWPQRIWAIENVHGLGKLLAQQLLRRGEQVVDVPTTLSHRTRRLSGQSGRKTDAHDARSVAIAAANPSRLRPAVLEDVTGLPPVWVTSSMREVMLLVGGCHDGQQHQELSGGVQARHRRVGP